MNRPLTVADLPPSPSGHTGWPWTQATPPIPARRSDGSEWPRISIVSPSFNQGLFLEETIRSVLLQGYPNLEYVIIDGGSTDASVDIIRKYAPFLSYWVSERDQGQCDAINKGFKRVDGDILAWINSDDFFEPGAFQTTAERLAGQSVWLTAASQGIMGDGKPFQLFTPELFASAADWVDHLLDGSSCCIPQTSTFWKKEGWLRSGPLREEMNYALDHDFFFRLYCDFGPPEIDPHVLSRSRIHPDCKSANPSTHFAKEIVDMGLRHADLLPAGQRWWVPFRVRKIQGRHALYESIELAEKGKTALSNRRLIQALALWPFLACDRMLVGFIGRQFVGTMTKRGIS